MPVAAKATDAPAEIAYQPMPAEEIENLEAPFREAVKQLSADEKQKIRDLEIQFLKTIVPPAETIQMSEHLRICRMTAAQLAPEYDTKIRKISTYNRNLMSQETKEFFEAQLPKATYIDAKILRNHLLADQMIMLEVNEQVIVKNLQAMPTDETACYVLRDQIDQYMIDNEISL